MAHDVFISHSTQDKAVADAVCAALENARIRCWIAPRDVQPGRSFGGEIARAIKNSKAMVLIFSAHSNGSEQVLREVQLSVTAHLHILQFRIEDVLLNDDLSYFLSTPHWLDALTPPLENHIDRLETALRALLGPLVEPSGAAKATVAQRFGSASSPSEKRDPPAKVVQKQEVSTAGKALLAPVNRRRRLVFAGASVALLTAGIFVWWWFEHEQPRKDAERQLTEQKEKDQRDSDATRREGKFKADGGEEKDRVTAQQRAKAEEAKKKEDSLKAVAAASREKPYVNSLGMKFVPVPGTRVLFSILETRAKDYKVFVEAKNREWPKPSFPQTEEHPAVNVSWEDATVFCEWLTESERKTVRITAKQRYRLPSDEEWSAAVGLSSDEEWSAAVGLEDESGGAPENTPEKLNVKVKGAYPWGTEWPPPQGAGNYDTSLKVDDHKETSPAGSFEANQHGIHDLGGNVWEWCQDWWNAENKDRVLRGASWNNYGTDYLLSSHRDRTAPDFRSDNLGFRCVLVVGSSR